MARAAFCFGESIVEDRGVRGGKAVHEARKSLVGIESVSRL
jgi:hypothetical protein